MPKGYIWISSIGPFQIIEQQDGLFSPYFEGVAMGAYTTAQFAVDDLADGHTKPHPSGIDTATLGIPHDLADWLVYEESFQTH